MDKEKVIKKAERIMCSTAGRDMIDSFCEDVITLLKEQEAKCLTKAELDDLDENQFVWIEGRTGYLYCLQIIGICRDRTGVSDIHRRLCGDNLPSAFRR